MRPVIAGTGLAGGGLVALAQVLRPESGAVTGAAIVQAGGVVHWLEQPGGVRIRVAHWPGGDRGVVLLLNGRTEFIEKHLETVEALRSRGFAVWTMDWRGQGASTRPLPVAHAHHVAHFDEYVGDAGAVLDRLLLPALDRRPLMLMAHSMGGHVGAHLLARRGALFACAVLCAPMIDFLRRGRGPGWLVGLIVRGMCLVPGRATRFAPGPAPLPELQRRFEGNRLTTCVIRHEADLAFVRANPVLALGGVTWGWLRAAMASVAALRNQRVLARIDMPVLVAMAGDERVVDNAAIQRFAMRLPRGKVLKIQGARHELLRETDAYRALLWSAIDAFLAPIMSGGTPGRPECSGS